MSTQYLFNRDWSTSIGIQGQTGFKYTVLKTVFDIDKTAISSSNKAKIDLYNLNDISRKNLEQKGLQVQLQAGYKGLIETLFVGNVAKTSSMRKGPDIITTIESGDGEKELAIAYFNKSYPPGTRYVTMIQDLAGALGVDIGTVLGIQDMVYNSGITLSGPVKFSLDKLLKRQALEWSIQNNALTIIPLTAHNGDQAIVLSQTSGLIGIPTQKDSGVEFIALLNPKILPGSCVQIVSNHVNGFYKVKRAHFEGDSHGQKWQVSCEGVPINAVQTIPVNQGSTFKTIP